MSLWAKTKEDVNQQVNGGRATQEVGLGILSCSISSRAQGRISIRLFSCLATYGISLLSKTLSKHIPEAKSWWSVYSPRIGSGNF